MTDKTQQFHRVMDAVKRADAAGDAAAAQKLAGLARSIMEVPEGATMDTVSGQAMAATPPRADDQVARTRRTPNRFGDTTADAVRGPWQATQAFWAGARGQGPSPSEAMGVPPGVSTVTDAGGAALSLLGTGYAGAAGLASEIVPQSRSREAQMARDLMMMGEVAVPELAGVSATVGATGRAARAAERLARPATPRQQVARATDDLGITPALGATGKAGGMAASALEKTPGSGGIIARDAARFVDEVETAFYQATEGLGRASGSAEAGQVLQGGLKRWADRFRANADVKFTEVAKHLPPDTKISAPNTVNAIRQVEAVFADTPEIARRLGIDRWSRVAGDLEGGLSWEAASELRSSIGRSIGQISGELADVDQGRLKQAYATLTADMEQAARQAGTRAESSWKAATNFYKNGAERIQKHLDKSISAQSPERAFEAFVNAAKKDRSSSDIQRIRAIKASMKPGEWRDVSASVVERLGEARAGAQNAEGTAFSPITFLTEYNKLSQEAKRLLLPENARTQLEKLAKAAETARDANAERNFSNTGNVAGGLAVAGGLGAAPITTFSLLAGANLSSRAMTSPVFLRALNRAARGDQRALRQIANSTGAFSQDARTLLTITSADASQQPQRAVNQ